MVTQVLQEALLDFLPTFAISDLKLPGYCGIEALQTLRARFPMLPLLMLTGQPLLVPDDVHAIILDKAQLARLPAVISQAITTA